MLVSKNHLLALKTASKDDSRPLLQRVQFTLDDDKKTVTAVATDSYILAEIVEEVPDIADYPEINGSQPEQATRALIEADVLAKVLRELPKSPLLPILTYAVVSPTSIASTDLDTQTIHNIHPVEGNYPDYKKLLPTPADKKVTLNPKYLAKAVSLFKDDYSVTMELGAGPLDPVVLRSEANGVKKTVLIMPLKS